MACVRRQLQPLLGDENLVAPDPATTALAETGEVMQPCLFIVDDDIASIQILRHTLAQMGDVSFATSGEDALHRVERLAPDLILLDAHMPGLDGFEVCKALKAQPATQRIPVVFVTRYSDPQSEMRALDLGAADFIAKPYTPAVLQARVRNLLELKRRSDAELSAMREQWRRLGDARVADIVAAASDAILTFNTDDELVLINAAACRLLALTEAQAIGASAQALLCQPLPDGAPIPGEAMLVHLTRPDGLRFPAELSMSRVGSGRESLVTVMLRDVSDRERLHAESVARIEAETASRTKTQMMTYIAHKMGNPLNGLLGFAQLMDGDLELPLAPKQAKRLAQILCSGQQLLGLLRDVMDLGRFETGKLMLDLRPVDLACCAQSALDSVAALAEQAGVSLSLLPTLERLRVSADADRLHQCLVNLLTNSIKYKRAGAWAQIGASVAADEITIEVRDNGLGMNLLQQQHLFEPFNRLGRQQAGLPGTGLGLVITRQLVEAMRGRLLVWSEVAQGSCFSVVLPNADPASVAAPDPAHTGTAADPVGADSR